MTNTVGGIEDWLRQETNSRPLEPGGARISLEVGDRSLASSKSWASHQTVDEHFFLDKGEAMNFRRLAVMLLAVAMLLDVGASAVQASGPGWCGGAPFYYPFYAQYGREHIPYFALHPPVYYSYPIPRTYGYSPFAYPFGSPTPEIVLDAPPPEKKPEPKTMLNPHVTQASHSEPTARVEPKVIYNPYVAAPLLAEARD